jgi:hypothetical protein
MPAITVRLSESARRDLEALADRERRDPREQAALLIEKALVRRRRHGRGSGQTAARTDALDADG